MKKLVSGKIVGFDTEGTGLSVYNGDRPFCFSFFSDRGESAIVELDVDPFTRRVSISPQKKALLETVLADPTVTKIGHNIKHDIRMARSLGIKVVGPFEDSQISAHVANSDEPSHRLKQLCNKYFDISTDDEKLLKAVVITCRKVAKKHGWKIHEDVAGDYWLPKAIAKHFPVEAAEIAMKFGVDLELVCLRYAILDAKRTLLLFTWSQQVLGAEGLDETYQREMKLWPVVYEMERYGVRLDPVINQQEIDFCKAKTAEYRKVIEAQFGEFNKKVSDDKLRVYLFGPKEAGGCEIIPDPGKLTKQRGMPQVTKDVLAEVMAEHPELTILRTLLEYNKHDKALSYFEQYASMAVKTADGQWVIHPSFNQVGQEDKGVVTSRFSSNNPNLQNVPKRAKKGEIMARVRRPFGPRRGCVWLHFDYKSIEAKIFAEEAMEPDMLRIFREGGDVYQELVNRVAEITKLDLEALFEDMGGARQVCKNNFLGWTYGEGKKKLARAMRIKLADAEKIVEALKIAFPRAMPFMWKMQQIAERQGFIINRYGRRTPIPPPIWKDGQRQSYYYKAVNYLIQSTAADLLKEAMIRMDAELKRIRAANGGHGPRLLLTIHDELIIECPIDMVTEDLVESLKNLMADNQGYFEHVDTTVDAALTVQHWSEPEKWPVDLKTIRKSVTIASKGKLNAQSSR